MYHGLRAASTDLLSLGLGARRESWVFAKRWCSAGMVSQGVVIL